jgi:2,6-dihydroxypseudooxynicotine hydrolase
VDDRLEAMYRRFTWRILSNYVTPWEFERLKGQITDYEQWCSRWSAHAARHVTRGDEALAAGHTVTAGDAYLRGALAYHWASFVFTQDEAQFRAALEAMAAAWAKAAPLLSPPMEILAVPFAGLTLPGYLRLPAGVHQPPVVVLLPGADSGKEELFNLADHIVARGLAVAAFDGPGQGMVSFGAKLRPDQEVAVQAIIDAVAARPDLDGGRVGVAGIAYGGLFAIRTAAVDDRVRAVVAMSSWYTPAGRFAAMDDLTRPGQYQHHGPDPAANMAAMTVAGAVGRATAPLLQVYGGNDPGSPLSQAERIAAEYGGPVTTVTYPDGVHILNNVWNVARPLVADCLPTHSDGRRAMDYLPSEAGGGEERFTGLWGGWPRGSAPPGNWTSGAAARPGPAYR